MPSSVESYVHIAGRTGRAGAAREGEPEPEPTAAAGRPRAISVRKLAPRPHEVLCHDAK